MATKITEEQFLEIKALFEEQAGQKGLHETEWDEIVKYMGLTYGDWYDNNKTKLYDVTAADSSDIFADGVASIAFSKMMDWFDLGVIKVKDESKMDQARQLCSKVKPRIYQMLDKGHFYDAAKIFVKQGGDLGTACMTMTYDNEENRARFQSLDVKDFWPVQNQWKEVTSIFREVQMLRREALKFFGEEDTPQVVKESTDKARRRFSFIQYICPVTEWEFDIPGTGDYLSIWWLKDSTETCKVERITEKAFACWRWNLPTRNSGVWGVNAPGQLALPIMKFLNVLSEDLLILSEQVAKGHWKKTKGLKVNFRAGGVTELEPNQDFAQITSNGNLSWLSEHVAFYRQVLQKLWKNFMFQVLTQSVDQSKTATEAAGLIQEQQNQAQNWPMRLDSEFLAPVVEWCFKQVLIYGDNSDLEKEEIDAIEDMEMEVRFISPLYKTQERNYRLMPTLYWIQDLSQLAGLNQNILDVVSFDQVARLDHEIRNALPECLISDDKVQAARQARADAQAKVANQNNQLTQLEALGDLYNKTNKSAEDGSAAKSIMDALGGSDS